MKLHYPEPPYYRKPLPKARLEEIVAARWFGSVATPDDAAAAALSLDWEDFRQERQNDLTDLVGSRLAHRGSEWNKCARAFGLFFDDYVAPAVSAGLSEARLPAALLPTIRWDVMSYMQELNYLDVRRPGFFHLLWRTYQGGHLPFGWRGAYPDGALEFG